MAHPSTGTTEPWLKKNKQIAPRIGEGTVVFFLNGKERTVGKNRKKIGHFFFVEDFLLLKNMRAFWGRESDICFFGCNLR